jgi:hypothetical protein
MVSEIMKKYLKNISPYVLIIAILIIALILTKECRRCPQCPEPTVTIITETDTIRDTVRIVSNVYIPVPGETIYIDPPEDVDCALMSIDYYAERRYTDTLKNDTSALIIVKDVVSQNILAQRQWEFINQRPTIINTTTNIISYDTCKQCKQFNLGFGGFISARPENVSKGRTGFIGFGPSILLTTNKKSSYGVSYDVINNIGEFSLYWNIK